MKMIEVFKTNVMQEEDASQLVQTLLQHFPEHRINFDLDDCDKILRVEGKNFTSDKIVWIVERSGFDCRILD